MFSGIAQFRGTNRLASTVSKYPLYIPKIRVESVIDFGSVRMITTHGGTSHYVFDTVDEIAEKIGWA